jgi:hypothetical protein
MRLLRWPGAPDGLEKHVAECESPIVFIASPSPRKQPNEQYDCDRAECDDSDYANDLPSHSNLDHYSAVPATPINISLS